MDISLHYMEKGSGTPLILLHGNGESSLYFRNQTDAFSACFHVFAIDTRGHGMSPRGAAPFTLEQFAEDLHDFMGTHEIHNAAILGFSDGANIAILFTLKYPEMVSMLILNGANLFPEGLRGDVLRRIDFSYRIARFFSHVSRKYLIESELFSLMVREPHIAPERLQDIHCPVLVIVGSDDMIRPEHSRLICDSLPDAQYSVIPGGHYIAALNSDKFNKVVLTFINNKIIKP